MNYPNNISGEISIENLIERKRKNLEAIFDAIPIGLLLIDENLIIVRVNNAIRKLLKKDYSEIINRPIGDAFDCVTLKTNSKACGMCACCGVCPITQNIKNVLRTGRPISEFEFQSATHFIDRSSKPWLSMNIEPIVLEDKKYVVVCLDDISAKKQVEDKLLETMELKAQFISTVSHELRTPLTAIKEGISIVMDGIAGKLKPKQREFLELSKRNVDRLSILINDVLDFQKLESGRMKFDLSPNDVAKTIREAADTMKLFADKHKVKMFVNIASDIGRAMFDRNRIIQVLTNLLSNAIKFTPESGSVTLDAARQNNEIVIAVTDTGMGIPKDDLPKIFERFYRVKRPGKEIQGTGLGLPIVAQIITQHSGRILVDSELDKGTTFTVCLPTTPPKDEQNTLADETLEKTILPQ
ncbi:MAG: PAS domain-containing sensor histidine kinase [Phycisphaerae bacterium]|jgi:signal transduction histidine kinase